MRLFLDLPPLACVTFLPFLEPREQVRLALTHPLTHRFLCPRPSDLSNGESASLAGANLVLEALRRQAAAATTLRTVPAACVPSSLSTLASSLSFWQTGPGWRSEYLRPIQSGTRYEVFEQGWLHLVPPVAVTGPTSVHEGLTNRSTGEWTQILVSYDLLQALRPAPTAAELEAEAEQLKRAAFVSKESTFGVGNASSVPHSRALSITPSSQDLARYLAALQMDVLSAPVPPILQWDAYELRYFMHAWQAIHSVASRMQMLRARCSLQFSNCDPNGVAFAPEVAAALRVPLPFLLRWPVAGGRDDTRPAAAAPRITSHIHDYDLGVWEADPTGSGVPFDPTEDLNQIYGPNVAALSSIVRGCPWPLDVVEAEEIEGQT